MNPRLECAALRARSWLMAHHHSGPGPIRRLVNWSGDGSQWRWVAAVPALVVVVTAVGVWCLAAQVAGVGAILAGWSPPLTLDAFEDLLPCPEPSRLAPAAPDRLVVDDDDPAAWNFNNDPWARLQLEQLAVQREYLAELRLQRQARADDLTATQEANRVPEPVARPAVPSHPWPPAPVAIRRPRPVRAIRAVVILALVIGLAWGIGAFSLGVASSAGWIRQPPSFAQLDQANGGTP